MPPEPKPVTEGADRRTIEDRPPDAVAGSDDRSPPDAETRLPLDVVYDLLSNDRRRRVLRYLLETPETTLGDLAEHIAAIENDKPEKALSSTERKRVYIVLYQCHLPRMDDAGVIDFDEGRKTVEVGGNFQRIIDYLPVGGEVADEHPGSVAPLVLVPVVGGLFVLQSYVLPSALLSGVLIGILIASVAVAAMQRVSPGSAPGFPWS